MKTAPLSTEMSQFLEPLMAKVIYEKQNQKQNRKKTKSKIRRNQQKSKKGKKSISKIQNRV